ncbi:hypothetical protein SOCEGT47_057160 [Sorangium cellulosum]|uniref:Reverse transcriptase domain-containing protein n=1 Tax=Sorangium cellulosum TaxID=56 RepID=A0A4V0NE73_SORCE|nr:antiviral reverse transcriptase Drt2 [Sorangium cellulosum]AUX25172.1 hypothetical protein SOCEGT47_057160 [Sorangium cellulosum]
MGWYRVRGYPHFDQPISEAKATALVTDPARVARHSFWPFVAYERVEQRFDWDTRQRKDPKRRPVAYASHVDSHVYAYYAVLLSEGYERELTRRGLGDVVLAYRTTGKSNVEFAKEAFERIRQTGACVALCRDLKSYFDTIDHGLLKRRWCTVLGEPRLPDDHYAVYRSLTTYAKVDRNWMHSHFNVPRKGRRRSRRICSPEQFRAIVRQSGSTRAGEPRGIIVNRDKFGIPQGSPISALLSNVYLLELDEELNKVVSGVDGFYRRYCDDILIVCPPCHKLSVERKLGDLLDAHKLKLNRDKSEDIVFTVSSRLVALHPTRGSHFPMQYLGFSFDGEHVRIRPSSISRFYRKMRKRVWRSRLSAARHVSNKKVFRGVLYERYTHLGGKNFVSYAYRSARSMNDNGIRRQLRRHWDKLDEFLKRPLPRGGLMGHARVTPPATACSTGHADLSTSNDGSAVTSPAQTPPA